MTEHDWLTSTDPAAMLRLVTMTPGSWPPYTISDRKLRLWCGVLRDLWTGGDKVEDVRYRKRWNEGIADPDEDEGEPIRMANLWANTGANDPSQETKANLLREICGNPFRPVVLRRSGGSVGGQGLEDLDWQAPWLTPAAISLARHIHDDRDFDVMPMLADLLEGEGCTDQTLLRHLRGEEMCWWCGGTGEVEGSASSVDSSYQCNVCHGTGWRPLRCGHVRGCWALDTILGVE